MFIYLLNNKERRLFLELAFKMANCDNDFSQEEVDMIEQFRKELLLFEKDYEIKNIELEEIFNGLKDSKNKIKKAIFVEIMALVWADGLYHEEERKIVTLIQKNFNISGEMHNQVENWIHDMKKLYERANTL